jgi:signal transduction histidine kinase
LKKLILSILLAMLWKPMFPQSTTAIDSLEVALKKYDAYKMELKLPTSAADTVKAQLLQSLVKAYIEVDINKSNVYAGQLLSLSKQINFKKGMGNAYIALGKSYLSKSNDSALIFFEMAKQIGEETGEKKILGMAYNGIGGYYDHKGDYSEALKNFISGLKLQEEAGNLEGAADAHRNIGYIYLVMRKFDDAMQHHRQALEISTKTGNMHGIGSAYNALGNDYADQNKDDEALKNYNNALKIHLENGFLESASFLYLNIGDLYKKQTKYDEAIASYVKGIELGKELDYKRLLTISYIQLGAVYETLGDLDSAVKYLNLGLDLALKANQFDFQKQAYRILSMVYDKKKDWKGAYQNMGLYLQTYEKVFNEETNKNITQLQMQYEFDKKEAATKAEQQRQKLKRNLIYAGMGLAVVFLVILLIQRNKIAKERRQIALEQERMRISRDLHDDLGSGLTGILMMSEQLQETSPKELVNNNLDRIKKSSRQMVEQMGEIVWAMNSKNDTLENLLGYLNTYARDYFENIDIKQQIELPETIPHAEMTGMKRRNIFLVVKESLNNIVKHANATQVSISMTIDKNQMQISVADNGKGFAMDNVRRFGNGLKNMQSRMEDIKGSYSIESFVAKGTKTVISFPLT